MALSAIHRRRAVRWSPATPITVHFLLDGYVATWADVVDISIAGLGILAGEALAPEDGYEVRLTCEGLDQPVVLVQGARLVWWEDASQPGQRRVGVHFDRRHRHTRLALQELIHATCSTPPPTRQKKTASN